MNEFQTSGDQLTALLDHFGIERVNVAVGLMSEPQAHDLVRARPTAVASMVYVQPSALNEDIVRPHVANLAVIVGGANPPPLQARVRETMARWEDLRVVDLPDDYPGELWSDVIADHPMLVVDTITQTTDQGLPGRRLDPSSGRVAGIHYQIEGQGPPLLLFPLGLFPTQWEAARAALRERFTLIRLGGPHLGAVQALEQRASSPAYLWGVRGVLARMEIQPGDRILEVGTGSGALVRDLARRTAGQNPIVAADINDYLLAEAESLARDEGLDAAITFRPGNAEHLPFEDAAFDVVFAATVLEECDADAAIGELYRVLKPGGRAAAIIRSNDLPQYWHVDVDAALRQKLMSPIPQGVAAQGVADVSLYERFARVFDRATPCPFWGIAAPPAPAAVARASVLLEPSEAETLRTAVDHASSVAFATLPLHAVVGQKTVE